jgi:hypothetical protein
MDGAELTLARRGSFGNVRQHWPFFRIDPHLENLREEPACTRLVADIEQTYGALKIQRVRRHWQAMRRGRKVELQWPGIGA